MQALGELAGRRSRDPLIARVHHRRELGTAVAKATLIVKQGAYGGGIRSKIKSRRDYELVRALSLRLWCIDWGTCLMAFFFISIESAMRTAP